MSKRQEIKLKNQGIFDLLNLILEMKKTKAEYADSEKLLENVRKVQSKLNLNYIFSNEEGDFIKLRKGIETHLEDVHDEISTNLADWKLKLTKLQEEVDRNEVYKKNEDLRLVIIKTLSNIEDATVALNQRMVQNRIYKDLLKAERELLESEPSLKLQKLKAYEMYQAGINIHR